MFLTHTSVTVLGFRKEKINCLTVCTVSLFAPFTYQVQVVDSVESYFLSPNTYGVLKSCRFRYLDNIFVYLRV